jgi:hypothetical protein
MIILYKVATRIFIQIDDDYIEDDSHINNRQTTNTIIVNNYSFEQPDHDTGKIFVYQKKQRCDVLSM